MGQENVTCGVPVCDFSVDSVVIEGPSRLGCLGGGKMGVLTGRTCQGASASGSGSCAVVARGYN